jgi:F-type H+-transporting ATPase subunit b
MKKIQNSKFKIQTITVLAVSLMFAAAAFASGGGGGEAVHFTWRDWLWPVVNFSILMFILVFFGRKPMSEYFKGRTEMIERSIREANEAKELAQKTLKEVQDRLKNTESEIEQIIESARRSGEKEKEFIIAEGEKLKEKIIEQAKANIDFELQKAKDTIKTEASLLALELAEKQIKEKLGQKEQEALIGDYIKRLEAKN